MEKRKSKLKQKWFLIIGFVLLSFFIMAFGREYVGNLQVEHEIEALQQQKQDQEQLHLETSSLIDQLSSEYFLEHEGRVKQGLGREGETVIVIEDDLGSSLSDKETDLQDDNMTNVTRWFYYFFSHDVFDGLVSYESS